ncbi:hypothetical protein PS712_06103 [Pseudomonas fluorescens]|uniref:Uncharacterized protein n=1 Tax=Pseudomonas fluorescens TaxID=294 RepID=A0A5E7FV61_PSEFL|nr:hypothetical protein PS712_06103 [Pseudomonas fluorescens]
MNVPGVIGPEFSPTGTRSAPWMSLVSTLPLRVNWVSEATPLSSSMALGTSSVMLTSSEPVAVSPLVSPAITVKCSLRVVPSPLVWDSLPLRV